ncbi:hypothetical protein FOMPIDRAFT_1025158 [Fomitopsis schrenkii]|uniref:PARP catalytic domain-containing protein n=1 Tax=Fomitopsis schrenkii TaxID=2126942 RepID=S8E0S1_FOMSC|nr:hypothetical protein FOMPIDRAFT_1025158 [Fomitopsis schrenkii]
MAVLNRPQLCKNCQTRPVRIEGNRVHDFCGLRCYNAFQSGATDRGGPGGLPLPSSSSRLCKLPGCEQPTYIGPDRIPSDYCSNVHRLQAIQDGAAEMCLLCSQRPKARVNGALSDFCSRRCSEDTFKSAPLILPLDSSMASFTKVLTTFNAHWTPEVSLPTIVKIWRIYCDKDRIDEFSRNRLAVERRINFRGGNRKRTWYGAVRVCTVGDSEGESHLCGDSSCSVCHIIRTSFHSTGEASKGDGTADPRRPGTEICSYTMSSTADSHVVGDTRSPYRAVLFSDVIVGEALEVAVGGDTPTEPPDGYDSVVVQLDAENRDYKAIVYDDKAILPRFLVIYGAAV